MHHYDLLRGAIGSFVEFTGIKPFCPRSTNLIELNTPFATFADGS